METVACHLNYLWCVLVEGELLTGDRESDVGTLYSQ